MSTNLSLTELNKDCIHMIYSKVQANKKEKYVFVHILVTFASSTKLHVRRQGNGLVNKIITMLAL